MSLEEFEKQDKLSSLAAFEEEDNKRDKRGVIARTLSPRRSEEDIQKMHPRLQAREREISKNIEDKNKGNFSGSMLAQIPKLLTKTLSKATTALSEASGNPLNERGKAIVEGLDNFTEGASELEKGVGGQVGQLVGEGIATAPVGGAILKGADKLNDAAKGWGQAGRANALAHRILNSAGDAEDAWKTGRTVLGGTQVLPRAAAKIVDKATGRVGKAAAGGAAAGALVADKGSSAEGALGGAVGSVAMDTLARGVAPLVRGIGTWSDDALRFKDEVRKWTGEDAQIPLMMGADDSLGSLGPKAAANFASIFSPWHNRYTNMKQGMQQHLQQATIARVLRDLPVDKQTKSDMILGFKDHDNPQILVEDMLDEGLQAATKNTKPYRISDTVGEFKPGKAKTPDTELDDLHEWTGKLRNMQQGKTTYKPRGYRGQEIGLLANLGKKPERGQWGTKELEDMYKTLSEIQSPGMVTRDPAGRTDFNNQVSRLMKKPESLRTSLGSMSAHGSDLPTLATRHGRAAGITSGKFQDFAMGDLPFQKKMNEALEGEDPKILMQLLVAQMLRNFGAGEAAAGTHEAITQRAP